jgi:hypothetical protein
MFMAEIPSVELARLAYKELQAEQFRQLLAHALDAGLLSGLAREISCSAYRIALGPISIDLIVRRRPDRQRRTLLRQLSQPDQSHEKLSAEVQKPWHRLMLGRY